VQRLSGIGIMIKIKSFGANKNLRCALNLQTARYLSLSLLNGFIPNRTGK